MDSVYQRDWKTVHRDLPWFPGSADPDLLPSTASLNRHKHYPSALFQRFALMFARGWVFIICRCDSSLSITNGGRTLLLAFICDDIVLTCIFQIINSSHAEFSMTDLGSLNYFLGIFVTRNASGYGAPISDSTLYRSLAGALQYLTFTRPDISYAVQQALILYDVIFSGLLRDANWAGLSPELVDQPLLFVFSGQQSSLLASKRQVTSLSI
ncbi:ribonuclease H-like domain-containing protein [Tanacetum coccineum]